MLWLAAVATTHTQNRRYLLEHGLVRMEAGVQEFERAVESGLLKEDDWSLAYDHLGKNMGHFCMILRWLVSREGTWVEGLERRSLLRTAGGLYS